MAALLDVLDTWMKVNDPWLPDYRERKAAATETLLAEVGAMADAGERPALRLWAAIRDEQDFCARNAAAESKMHRKVPDYGAIIHSEHARLTADRDGIPAGAESTWCPTCRTRREVIEVDPTASTYEGHHELGWTNTNLACGHQLQTEARIIGASPGGEAATEAIAGAATQKRLEKAAAWNEDPWPTGW